MSLGENFKGTYGTMYMVRDMTKSIQYYKEVLNLTSEEESPAWTTFNLNGHRRGDRWQRSFDCQRF